MGRTLQRMALIAAAWVLWFGMDRALAQSRPEGIDSDFRAGAITWSTVAADGIQFACIKATALDEGFSNSVFAACMSGAQAAGIYTIPYNRCDPSVYEPQTEAQFFWSWARTNLAAGGYNLSPALDVEDGLTGSYIGDNGDAISLSGWCNEWYNDVSNYAATAGVRLRQLTYVNAGSSCTLNSSIGGYSWIAWTNCAYPYGSGKEQTNTPWCGDTGCEDWGSGVWSIWQWAWPGEGQGILSGLPEHVDQDVYNGTLAQMIAALGTTSIAPSGFSVNPPGPTNVTLYAGQSFTYSAQATGTTPFYYHWYAGTNASKPIPNATNAACTVVAALGSSNYFCQVSNSFNGLSVTSFFLTLTGIAAPTDPYPATVLSNGPIAYWRLDETNGNIAYDYAGGHNATCTNTQPGVPGYNPPEDPDFATLFGTNFLTQISYASNSYALEINQSSNGLPNIDFATTNNGVFSVEAWVNLNPQTSSGCIITKGYGHGEQFDLDLGAPNTDFRFYVRNYSGATSYVCNSTNHPDGNWHYLAGVCDEVHTSAWLCVDGVVAAKVGITNGAGLHEPVEGTAGLGDNRVSIGARLNTQTSTAFDLQTVGTLDEVAIYDYALSSNQVAAHYQAGLAVSPGTMTITNLPGGQVQLSWNFSGTLQSATNLTGPYGTVTNVSPYTVPATNAGMFYRIRQR